jgi:stage II sporulation protein D
VTVNLAEVSSLRVFASASLRIRGSAREEILHEGHCPDGLVVARDGDRIRMGDLAHAGPLVLEPAGPPRSEDSSLARGEGQGVLSVEMESPEGALTRRRYRGVLEISVAGSRLRLHNKLSMEEYLAGVLGAEVPASAFPLAALEAQAVAARTYAMYALRRDEERGRALVFTADEAFQVYAGVDKEHPRALQAIRETVGEVLTFQGAIFRSYFHSTCGGRTVDAWRVFDEPVLRPFGGVECARCGGARFASWQASFSPAQIEAALASWAATKGIHLGGISEVEVSEKEPDGRARYLRIRHGGGSFEVHAPRFRGLLAASGLKDLRSTAFQVSKEGGSFVFKGRGWGHGVGLCQEGAARMGATESYRSILSYYYPGSDVTRAY